MSHSPHTIRIVLRGRGEGYSRDEKVEDDDGKVEGAETVKEEEEEDEEDKEDEEWTEGEEGAGGIGRIEVTGNVDEEDDEDVVAADEAEEAVIEEKIEKRGGTEETGAVSDTMISTTLPPEKTMSVL